MLIFRFKQPPKGADRAGGNEYIYRPKEDDPTLEKSSERWASYDLYPSGNYARFHFLSVRKEEDRKLVILGVQIT